MTPPPSRPRQWEWSEERMGAFVKKYIHKEPYFAADETVVAWTFFKKSSWKKYTGTKKPEPIKGFMFHPVHTIRYCKELSEKHSEKAPYGYYFIPYFQPNWPILVIPNTAPPGHDFIYGNHISLPYEPTKSIINAHYTHYIPDGTRTKMGFVRREFAKFPNPCMFPPEPSVLDISEYREPLIEFLSYAKLVRPTHNRQKGGSLTYTETTYQLSEKALNHWEAAKFHSIGIIGVRTAQGYDLTLTAYDTWGPVGMSFGRPLLCLSLTNPSPERIFPYILKWLERGQGFLTTNPGELEEKYAI